MQRKNQIIWVILFILVSGVILTATSYAYIGHRAIQEEKNTANTSCFQVEFEESEGILLENASPLSEAEAYDTIKPYKFKITNTCVNYTDYQINLESLMLDEETKVLSDQYLDVTLVNYDTLETHYITSLEEVTTPVLSDAKNAYILKSGKLGSKESVEYGLWVWLEYNTPVVDEVMNAKWKGKITVQTTFAEKMD